MYVCGFQMLALSATSLPKVSRAIASRPPRFGVGVFADEKSRTPLAVLTRFRNPAIAVSSHSTANET